MRSVSVTTIALAALMFSSAACLRNVAFAQDSEDQQYSNTDPDSAFPEQTKNKMRKVISDALVPEYMRRVGADGLEPAKQWLSEAAQKTWTTMAAMGPEYAEQVTGQGRAGADSWLASEVRDLCLSYVNGDVPADAPDASARPQQNGAAKLDPGVPVRRCTRTMLVQKLIPTYGGPIKTVMVNECAN